MKILVFFGVLSISMLSSEFTLDRDKRQIKDKINYLYNGYDNMTADLYNNPQFYNIFNNEQSIPKNIIMVIVEETNGKDYWKKFQETYYFPMKGFFTNCNESQLLNSTLIRSFQDNCECEKHLKNNINELMVWAQLVKEMNIATISSDNFTLPSVLNNKNAHFRNEKLNNNIAQANEPTIFRIQLPLAGIWPSNITNLNQSMPLSLRSTTASLSDIKSPINETNDPLWNFINNLYQLRLSIFKPMIDTVRKQFPRERVFSSNESNISMESPKLSELIYSTIMDLKLISNDKGFLFITVIPDYQLTSAYRTIQYHASIFDTLTVVTGKCSDKKNIPYVASRPQSILNNVSTIYDLPIALKLTLNGCTGICSNKTWSLAALRSDVIQKKRVARSDDEDKSFKVDKFNKTDHDSLINKVTDSEDKFPNSDPYSDPYSSDFEYWSRQQKPPHHCTSSSLTACIFTTLIMCIMCL